MGLKLGSSRITLTQTVVERFISSKRNYLVTITGSIIPRHFRKGNQRLTDVEIPDGITILREGAFENCTALKTVTIPASLKRIERNAFAGCTALESLNLPKSLLEVDCWLSRNVAKLTLSRPFDDMLLKNFLDGYVMDLHYNSESRWDYWD